MFAPWGKSGLKGAPAEISTASAMAGTSQCAAGVVLGLGWGSPQCRGGREGPSELRVWAGAQSLPYGPGVDACFSPGFAQGLSPPLGRKLPLEQRCRDVEAAGEKGSRLPGARRAPSTASAQLTPVVTATSLSVERATSDTEQPGVLTRPVTAGARLNVPLMGYVVSSLGASWLFWVLITQRKELLFPLQYPW